MNLYTATQLAVLARPGMDGAEVAAHLGFTQADEIKKVGAYLSKLAGRNKVQRRTNARTKRVNYYPTASCGVNLRDQPRAVRPPPIRLLAPRKPTDAQQFRIVDPTQPKAIARAGAAETVEEFQARGGTVQQLPPHHSANPLRFDHHDTAVPMGRRRPVVRARPAAAR